MESFSIIRLLPDELDRLIALHNRLSRVDPALLPWSGERLRARYEEWLAHGEMAVWLACESEPESGKNQGDTGYAWFQANRGEFSLKETGAFPEKWSAGMAAALIGAGLAWIRQAGGRSCRYTGLAGEPALTQSLLACGFQMQEEHIQMRTHLSLGLAVDSGLKIRTFAEIGDASWLLSLVEECLECRHTYDRQDMLDAIKRNDGLCFTAWNADLPAGFLMGGILPRHGRPVADLMFYVEELGVHPAYRRQGYATRLLAEGFARARGRGMREAHLHVVGDNQAGLRLYRKMGFEEVQRVGWWQWMAVTD